ncbi:hypothetical protein SBA6_770018 [Candidatus Sulfopaludibacter sp. SbA6]|nr:hypothetical protein SBA6_770018 [Candidatus Sulfopaludibacter sp. SbA6]
MNDLPERSRRLKMPTGEERHLRLRAGLGESVPLT